MLAAPRRVLFLPHSPAGMELPTPWIHVPQPMVRPHGQPRSVSSCSVPCPPLVPALGPHTCSSLSTLDPVADVTRTDGPRADSQSWYPWSVLS